MFILSFGAFLLCRIVTNVYWLSSRPFDPLPVLIIKPHPVVRRCAAAPVIMMSQNRQEEKDRTRAKNDYMINLKWELEIRLLHEKIDHLVVQQELIEIQKVQIGMTNDIMQQLGHKKPETK